MARDAVRRRTVAEHLAALDAVGDDPAAAAREILTLVAAMDRHDRPTRGHAERVRLFSDLVAEEMNLPRRDRDLLRWASLLHDIGKLTVDPTILNKPAKPTESEWEVLRAHPAAGAKLAAPLLPWLGSWGDLIIEHHERYDGTGYPRGLAGSDIGLGGRMVAVADAFDVMTAARAYRRPVSRAAAYRELVRFSGTQFDPACVRAMVAISAPRLRRAQGLVAWLGDVPLLATQSVPAATLAQVVGAGALVVAGPGLVAPGALAASPGLVAGPPASAQHLDGSTDAGADDGSPASSGDLVTSSSRATTGPLSPSADVPAPRGTAPGAAPTSPSSDAAAPSSAPTGTDPTGSTSSPAPSTPRPPRVRDTNVGRSWTRACLRIL
ncbi:MAG TPA: HD domain-containing phosphohydrolase [Actinomycetales bacterium]|nr:HD domain-containing phosphohydrolase [Actinomycetales bacterium]